MTHIRVAACVLRDGDSEDAVWQEKGTRDHVLTNLGHRSLWRRERGRLFRAQRTPRCAGCAVTHKRDRPLPALGVWFTGGWIFELAQFAEPLCVRADSAALAHWCVVDPPHGPRAAASSTLFFVLTATGDRRTPKHVPAKARWRTTIRARFLQAGCSRLPRSCPFPEQSLAVPLARWKPHAHPSSHEGSP